MTLQATIPFVSPRDLLLLLELNRRDGVVAVDGETLSGRITIARGHVVDAQAGDLTGAPALAALAAQATGSLCLEPFLAPAARTVRDDGPADLGEAPPTPRPEVEGSIEGDGALPTLAELLELFLINGRRARIRCAGGEVVVAGGMLVEATAGAARDEEALFALFDQGLQAFTAAPEPTAAASALPLHAAMVHALDRVFDAQALRRKAESDEATTLKSILEDLAARRLHPEVRVVLARRLMAGPEVAPLELVTRLCVDWEETVRAAAKETVEALDVELLSAVLANPATPMALVAHLIEVFSDDAELLVSAAEHPLLEEDVAIRLAELADPNVAQALLHSPVGQLKSVRDALSRDSDTSVQRVRSHEPVASGSAPAGEASGSAPPAPGGKKVAKRRAMLSLCLRDQILLAGAGNMRQQLSLVCCPTQMVACAVITSPRMNDNMALSVAQLTTANGEALRDLARARKFSNQYPIARLLAFNPKTPAGAVLDLLGRLKDNDLKSLARASGTAELVRTAAARLLATREDKRKLTK